MTKGELIEFLQSFTDDIVIIDEHGDDLVAKYELSTGEGFVVLTPVDPNRKAVWW